MASKRSNQTPRMPRAAPASSYSSDEDDSALQVVQRPTKNQSDGSDGDEERDNGDEVRSSDEIGENGALIKRLPPPKKNVAFPEAAETSQMKREGTKSPPWKKKKTKGKAAAAAPAAELARSTSPEKDATAAASEAAKSTPPKKAAARTEVAVTPPPTGPADKTTDVTTDRAGAEEDLSDAEKHLKEKGETYWHLWQMVLTLEKEHSLFLKGAFLKINDAKASILNTKIKNLCLREIYQLLRRKAIDKELTNALIKLIQ